jgi:plasmid stability protein
MAPVRTLYIRNVPDEVAERLERLASREGLSVNAFVVKELSEAARRADNRALLADLPDLDVSMEEIVAIIREMRGD